MAGTLMVGPFVLDNRGDIVAFDTIDELLAAVEPVDVEEREFDAFDSQGRAIELGTAPGGRFGNRQVVVANAEATPQRAGDLRRRLLEYLCRVGVEPGPPEEALGSVVARLVAWQSASWGRAHR